MKTKISDYIHVSEKLDELGCRYSEGIAILPVNFETATPTTTIEHSFGALVIGKLFRMNDIPCSEIRRENEKPSYIGHRSFEWELPTLFFSPPLLLANQAIVTVALSIIANFLTDTLKKIARKQEATGREQTCKLGMVVETGKDNSKTYKEISYEGPIDGLSELDEIVKEVLNK